MRRDRLSRDGELRETFFAIVFNQLAEGYPAYSVLNGVGLVSKSGAAIAPLLIFAALGRVLSTRCATPASDAASMRFAPCSYSRRKASQKLVTPKTPVQPLSTGLRLAGSSKSAFTTSAPSCLNVFAASESGCRVRQRTSALPSFKR